MPPKAKSDTLRSELIRSITTPLGFYVLALLIIEATLAIVLTSSKLPLENIWTGFMWMVGVFIGVLIVVTAFAAISPKRLLYGKEEHLKPMLEPSALKDQIEDLIFANVKTECLKDHQP
jgi:energy-coupling factor transporter transmembrane protein EcfT